MCHGLVRYVFSAPFPSCFGEQYSFGDDSKIGTNVVGFSDLFISCNREDYFLLKLCEKGHNGCGWIPLVLHVKEILIQFCRCDGIIIVP